jgi:hypothetical protein
MMMMLLAQVYSPFPRHSFSGYHALSENYNLRTIPDMMNRFGLVAGL